MDQVQRRDPAHRRVEPRPAGAGGRPRDHGGGAVLILFAHIDEPPFNVRNADGRLTGCDVERARAVADAIGEAIAFVEVGFAALLPGLALGDWAMATGLFATDERRAVPASERAPSVGCFALPLSHGSLLRAVDEALGSDLGSSEPRAMMRGFGFTDDEIDLVAA